MSIDDDWLPRTTVVRNQTTPWWPALAALTVAVLSIGLALRNAGLMANVVGYLLGGAVGPAVVAVDRALDNARKSSARHTINLKRARVVVFATALTLIGALGNAWLIATELAKR